MEERIPASLGAVDYATVWDKVAAVREHAFELVDESQSEEQLAASGHAIAPFLIRGLAMTREDVVIEIGCGVARLGKEIAPHVREWHGLDVSARMLEIASERCRGLENVNLHLGNGADLSGLPDACADKMYCHAVLIHMDKEDVYTTLRDARRVLKPGGLFYFDVWNLCHPVGWLRWQAERSLYRTRSDRPVHRNQFSTPDEVRTMLRMAGWELLQLAETFYLQSVVTYLPPPPTRAIADRESFLAQVRARYQACYEELHYTDGDERYMTAVLTARLRERGMEPEVRESGLAN